MEAQKGVRIYFDYSWTRVLLDPDGSCSANPSIAHCMAGGPLVSRYLWDGCGNVPASTHDALMSLRTAA